MNLFYYRSRGNEREFFINRRILFSLKNSNVICEYKIYVKIEDTFVNSIIYNVVYRKSDS